MAAQRFEAGRACGLVLRVEAADQAAAILQRVIADAEAFLPAGTRYEVYGNAPSSRPGARGPGQEVSWWYHPHFPRYGAWACIEAGAPETWGQRYDRARGLLLLARRVSQTAPQAGGY